MYAKTTLENGIRVVTEKISGTRSIAIGVMVDTGLRDEPENKQGIAHMAEHLMFQGTSSRSSQEIARTMDEAGGQMGGFTSRDYTLYTATVLDDYRTYALDLLGDILLNSLFLEADLEREKETITREIAATFDYPNQRTDAMLKAHVWQDHYLGRCIAGTPESVQSITREDLIYYVHSRYLPDRIIIAAAGNLEHDEFVSQVRDAFWRLMGTSPTLEGSRPPHRPGIAREDRDVSQLYFALGLEACPYAHPARYALHVFNKALGDGISSRLYRRIRDEVGMVYHIDSEYHAYRDAGMLVIEGSTSPELFGQVLERTVAELQGIMTGADPITDEEVWKAKMQVRAQHLIASENTHTRMGRLATQEFYFDESISTEAILEDIDGIEADMLRHFSQHLLINACHNPAIAVIGPDAEALCSSADTAALLNIFCSN